MKTERSRLSLAIMIVGGVLAGTAIGVCALLLSSWGRHGATWNAPALMDHMNCSEISICRHYPDQVMDIRDAAGGTFRVTANSIGFRVPNPPESGPGDRRLLIQIYGDSMIHGNGVDDGDTIALQMQAILQDRLPTRDVYVMNFGMPMNYLRSQLRIYEHWGRRYHPDIVVLEYHGHIPTPRDINYRVQQIRESAIISFLFRFTLGRTLINRYQTWAIGRYSHHAALEALRPGVALLERDRGERGLEIAVFSFVSDFDGLDEIFPNDPDVERIASGLDGWDGYRASDYIIPGDGHPNPRGTRFFAERIADGLQPLLPTARGLAAEN